MCFIFVVLTPCKQQGQSNLDFENWTNQGTYDDLDNWITANKYSIIGANISCTQQSPKSGNYSLGISPIFLPNKDTLQGFALQKFKYNQRAMSINLYYKYNGLASDSTEVKIEFYKGYSLDTANKIGWSNIYLSKQKTWSYLSSDIIWKNNLQPDSAIILINNSIKNKNDTAYFDDIKLSMFKTNIKNVYTSKHDFFFNNTIKRLTFDKSLEGSDCCVIIRNNIGQIVFKSISNYGYIDLIDLKNGIYFYECISNQFNVFTGKFIIL